jgi:hypothetical protein
MTAADARLAPAVFPLDPERLAKAIRYLKEQRGKDLMNARPNQQARSG